MAAIGFVNGTIEQGFVGQLKTLSIRAAIEIRTNRSKSGDIQPDYRVWSEGVEIGAGWIRVGQVSGEPYVSLSLAAPDFRPFYQDPVSSRRQFEVVTDMHHRRQIAHLLGEFLANTADTPQQLAILLKIDHRNQPVTHFHA